MLIGLFSLSTMIAAGYLDHTRVPRQDSWDLWFLRLSPMDFWTFLFTLHNGHRIPIPRLLYLADEKFFHAEAWALVWCTFLSQFATCVIFYRLARSKNSTLALRITIFGLTLAFLFGAPQWINFTSSLQVCFMFVYVTSIGALAALTKCAGHSWLEHPWNSGLWLMAAIVMALLAVGTSATGVLVWPLLVLLACFLRLPKAVIGVLLGLMITVPLAYLHNYRPIKPAVAPDLISTTPDLVAFALAYLGSAFNEPLMYFTNAMGINWNPYQVALAVLAGAVGIIWFFHILLTTLGEAHTVSRGRLTLLHIAAFLVGSAALSSVGRLQYSIITALTSRYTTPSVLFWCCLFLLTVSRPVVNDNKRSHYRLRIAALCAAVLVGGLIQLPKVAYAFGTERYIRDEEYAMINGAYDPNLWQRLYYSAGRMIPSISYFRKNHLAMFSRNWTQWVGDPATQHFRIVPKPCDCVGAWESGSSLAYSFRPSTISQGWAYDQHLKRAPKMIVFTDDELRILGFTTCTLGNANVTAQHPEFPDVFIGWVAYLPGGVAKDATAYAVLEDGKSLCPLGSMHLPGAYATAPASKAGSEVAGVVAKTDQGWAMSPPLGFGNPPYATPILSSYQLRSSTGELRLGPVKVSSGSSIGLPVAIGPGAKGIRLSVVNPALKEVLSVAEVPAGSTAWDLWRFDNPPGDFDLTIEYVIQDTGKGPNDWVVVGMPRTIKP